MTQILNQGTGLVNYPSDQLSTQITELEKDLKSSTFRPYRLQKQSQLLSTIMEEAQVDPETHQLTDHVSKRINLNNAKQTVCVKCSHVYEKQKAHVCPQCNFNTKTFPDRKVLYGDVPSQHPEEPPLVKMGEIVDVNPNSRKSIRVLLEKLVEQSNVGETRQWIRVGFDGVPYGISSSIIASVVVCNVCHAEVDTKQTPFELHVEQEHPGQTDIGHKLLFDNILLTPGAGHAEINLK